MTKALTLVLCALLLAGGGVSPAWTAPGWNNGALEHDGMQRVFRYYIPAARPEHPPLVILLHGGTGSMHKLFRKTSGAMREWPELAAEEDFILLTPNGVNEKTGDPQSNRQNWNDCRAPNARAGTSSAADDVGFMRDLITWSRSELGIDTARVYVTGASNGGMMTYRLAIELGNEIAAAAAFIANMPVDNECPPAVRPVPMMIVNGTKDPLMPWKGGAIMGHRGEVLSAQGTRDFWLKVNKADISQARTVALPDINKWDKSRVTRTDYPARPGGADTVFYEVINGGHTLPHPVYVVPRFMRKLLIGNQNRDFDSVRAAWNFLSQHRLKSQATP